MHNQSKPDTKAKNNNPSKDKEAWKEYILQRPRSDWEWIMESILIDAIGSCFFININPNPSRSGHEKAVRE